MEASAPLRGGPAARPACQSTASRPRVRARPGRGCLTDRRAHEQRAAYCFALTGYAAATGRREPAVVDGDLITARGVARSTSPGPIFDRWRSTRPRWPRPGSPYGRRVRPGSTS